MDYDKLRKFRDDLTELYKKYGYTLSTDIGNESVFIDNAGEDLVLVELEDGQYEFYVKESYTTYLKIH